MSDAIPLPSAEEIRIPPNDGAFSTVTEGISCRHYIRYHDGQDPALGAERTNYTVGVEVWGAYGPLIGLVMLVPGSWCGGDGYAARYRKVWAAHQFFPDPTEAVKWIKGRRAADFDRTDNGLRDTNGGRDS